MKIKPVRNGFHPTHSNTKTSMRRFLTLSPRWKTIPTESSVLNYSGADSTQAIPGNGEAHDFDLGPCAFSRCSNASFSETGRLSRILRSSACESGRGFYPSWKRSPGPHRSTLNHPGRRYV